ncbi:uncharacterized protein LOC132260479 [Phlebotomus argentipes]|uniref:uncharacterized protein LOC132260479 n=1 Tax=Phlebotomus argentipes TaxID=94469 RepID=UPI002892A281|nr:uncharacterized protein LOC132260479 [Phlebotomus argentipes]
MTMNIYYEVIRTQDEERFSLSWLAATNPTIFRNRVRKAHLETIRVEKICDEILKVLNTSEEDPNKRLSLHLAANLTYGTVKIHQRMVDNILEDVTQFMTIQTFVQNTLMRQEKPKKSKPAKKRGKKAKSSGSKQCTLPDFSELTDLLEPPVDDSQDDSLPEALFNTTNDLITLREVELSTHHEISDIDDDFFGELNLNSQEASFFKDFLDRSFQSVIADSTFTVEAPKHETPSRDSPITGLTMIPTLESPESPQTPQTQQSVFQYEEIPLVASQLPLSPPDTVSEDEEEFVPARKRRKKTLKTDKVMRISDTQHLHMLKNFKKRQKGRVEIPGFRADRNVLTRPCRKRNAEPLMDQFSRNCKIRCLEEGFEDFLLDILFKDSDPNNNMPGEEVMGPILEDFNRFGRKKSTRKRQREFPLPPAIEEFTEPPPVPRDFQEIPQEHRETDWTLQSTLAKLQTHWNMRDVLVSPAVLLNGVVARKDAARAFMSILQLVKLKMVKLHSSDDSLEIRYISPGQ